MTNVSAWAVYARGDTLNPYEYRLNDMAPTDVEVRVEHCGICYSDLAFANSEWGPTAYPLVPGHEVIGTLTRLGSGVSSLRLGQRVGIGWWASSCGTCRICMEGRQNFCKQRQATIVGRHGGFANHVRAHWSWCVPLPDSVDPKEAGPLLCGGLTVFSPLLVHDVKPTHRVGVVGIGGLGHMAVRFSRAWGCHVTALTSSPAKCREALELGAHAAVIHTDGAALTALTHSLDFLLVSARGPVDWNGLLETLAPDGRLHVVGVPNQNIPINVRPHLITWRRSVSGSSTGSPTLMATMLDFAARHSVLPRTEHFPMSRVNDAVAHLRSGKARYRIVLDADF